MSRRLSAIIACVLAVSISSTAFAGAWTLDKYHFYLQLSTSFSLASSRFSKEGDSVRIKVKKNKAITDPDVNLSNYQQLFSDLYWEFAPLPRFTVFGDFSLISSRQKNPKGEISYSATGLADFFLGARTALLVDPIAVALEARLTFPTGDPSSTIPTGSGDFREEFRLAIGKGFSPFPLYFDLEFGFTLRGTGKVLDLFSESGRQLIKYAPEIVLHAEIGGALVRWKGADRLALLTAVDYRGSTERSEGADQFTILPENSEATTITAALIWYVYHGIGVTGRFTQIVQGRRLPITSTVAGAVFVKY